MQAFAEFYITSIRMMQIQNTSIISSKSYKIQIPSC
jgi:hypothetical protein